MSPSEGIVLGSCGFCTVMLLFFIYTPLLPWDFVTAPIVEASKKLLFPGTSPKCLGMKTVLLLSVLTHKCLNRNLICFIDFESSIQLEKCFGKEVSLWYSIHIQKVPENCIASCITQLISGCCEHGLVQLCVPVSARSWNALYCRPTCI